MDKEANIDSFKEGTNFVVGERNLSPYELEALFLSYYLTIYLRDILMRRF